MNPTAPIGPRGVGAVTFAATWWWSGMAPACSPRRSCRSRWRLLPSKRAAGPFAMNRFPLLPLEKEGRLKDVPLRENFVARVEGSEFYLLEKMAAEIAAICPEDPRLKR